MTDVVPSPPRHPAKFSTGQLEVIDDILRRHFAGRPRGLVLDPFAGTGLIHGVCDTIGLDSVGVELEPEWATMHPRTLVGDATALPFADDSVDAIVTSPAFGNRMADHQEARERCSACAGAGYLDELGADCPACGGLGRREWTRNTYRHTLGRALTRNNTGAMQWGTRYRNTHRDAWAEAARVLRRRSSRSPGIFVVDTKDFTRTVRGKLEHVHITEWHHGVLRFGHGMVELERHEVEARGLKHGANRDQREPHHVIAVFGHREGP